MLTKEASHNLKHSTMTKINISKFSNYDSKAMYEFLFLKRETVFEIIIPRNAITVETDNYDIFSEYLSAAYAGQRLSEIADSFAYYVPFVNSKNHFLFEVTITEKGKMAEILYLIIKTIYGAADSESFLSFHSLAADFLTNAFNDKIECYTWGLLYIADRYLQMS